MASEFLRGHPEVDALSVRGTEPHAAYLSGGGLRVQNTAIISPSGSSYPDYPDC